MNEITQNANGNGNGSSEALDTMRIAGGMALIVFGAGLLMSNAGIRKLAKTGITRALPDLEKPFNEGIAGMLPDLERYMKIRSM
jgi:hypothetical protein